ncbi:hypothetical protein LUW77_03500 [Streptomyces radiopugnans]|nr:hypothetical protein LUW77_03500 [Streptomyces radiopugnans]
MAVRGRGRVRYVVNPAMYGEIARSSEMRDMIWQITAQGAAILSGLAPVYVGPTWKPGVERGGEYKRQIFAELNLQPNGWRGQFGSDALWTLQVEFGTGGGGPAGGTTRDSRGRFRRRTPRPQHGWSPKHRPLGRTLDAMRAR